jgi:hypothetical protein
MKKVCFFSSDARPLYKQDVFRAMSYPNGYVIHFRYQQQHVNGGLQELLTKPGVIFFSMGNDLQVEPKDRVITHASIREVKVHSIETATDTGQIHFYLELGDFKVITLGQNSADIMPPNKFVTELEIVDGPVAQWYQIIDIIKTSFPKQLFYKFQILDKKNRGLLPLSYDKVEKQSFYKLSDEKSYALEMAFYDTESSNSNNYHSLKISAIDDKLLQVVAPATIDLEARRDNRVYSLFTKTVSSSNSFTYINFETLLKTAGSAASTEESSKIDTTLKIQVKKSLNRSLAFALYSLMAALAIGYAKVLTDQVDVHGTFNTNLTLQFVICGLIAATAAFNLYRLFDKK